jgi:two-component system, cell cycle sensor histidine kinase and response regulator CckA
VSSGVAVSLIDRTANDSVLPPTVTGLPKVLRDAIAEVVWSGLSGGTGLSIRGNVERLCRCEPEEMLRHSSTIWIERAHAADRARLEDAFSALVATATTFDEEYRWQRWDGSWIWLHGRAVMRPGAEAPVIDAVFADVSDRRALVDQIRHLQRIEVVGEFTGGIAHDFNNLLAIILANTTLLLDALADDDPRRADAVAALEAGERAAHLTRQLLPFTRKHAFEPRIVDVNEIVAGAEQMLRRLIGEDIELSIRLAPDVGHTRADAHLLEQVLMNLVVNARDAMSGGGKLSIETSAAPGRVRLAVSDTGCGMDAATRQRIFEPFFTTKARGKGTGLGLATSHAIVREAGGTIRVDSEPGRGTIFEILLPLIEADASGEVKGAGTHGAQYPGTETILVVEDDEGVRMLVRRLLVRAGYRVFCARDAQEALAMLYSCGANIDLALSDVILPQVNGAEVVRSIQARSPRTRALFMSGHALRALVQKSILPDDAPFIHKPFSPGALARRIREVLDA